MGPILEEIDDKNMDVFLFYETVITIEEKGISTWDSMYKTLEDELTYASKEETISTVAIKDQVLVPSFFEEVLENMARK